RNSLSRGSGKRSRAKPCASTRVTRESSEVAGSAGIEARNYARRASCARSLLRSATQIQPEPIVRAGTPPGQAPVSSTEQPLTNSIQSGVIELYGGLKVGLDIAEPARDHIECGLQIRSIRFEEHCADVRGQGQQGLMRFRKTELRLCSRADEFLEICG